MRPFEIDKSSITEELFANSPDSNICWPAGAFDYQLKFYEYSRKETDQICEWLSKNCTNNFIVIRDESQIIAGGYSDNKTAWKQKNKKSFKRDLISEVIIRLQQSDIFLFRMVWMQ